MVVLCLFCLELLVCVVLGWPIVAALLVGLVLFVGWALRQGYGLRAVGGMLWSGIRTAKNVLIVFLLIGVLTALWRVRHGAAADLLCGRSHPPGHARHHVVSAHVRRVRAHGHVLRRGGHDGRRVHDGGGLHGRVAA